MDLSGYTRLTEERGDRFAADVPAELTALVKGIARRRGGSPIRWLGDEGMFQFRDPAHAMKTGLEMVASVIAEQADGWPGHHLPAVKTSTAGMAARVGTVG